MIEQERKFLLKSMPKTDRKLELKQAYLMFDDDKHLRVRIYWTEHYGKEAYLTFKTIHSSTVRTEYEYEIPVEDAEEMFESSNSKLQKTRYVTYFEGNRVDIDVYPDGLAVVEIEYENELVNIPDYCGEEITGQSKYSNISIANSSNVKINI